MNPIESQISGMNDTTHKQDKNESKKKLMHIKHTPYSSSPR